jgi:hypothetical protein
VIREHDEATGGAQQPPSSITASADRLAVDGNPRRLKRTRGRVVSRSPAHAGADDEIAELVGGGDRSLGPPRTIWRAILRDACSSP